MVCADFGLSRFLPEHEEFCCRTGKPMTNLPPKLEAALTAAADALADLPAETWDALCREEAAELIAAHQYFAAVGFPQHFPPERILGARIIRAFAARYPALAFARLPDLLGRRSELC